MLAGALPPVPAADSALLPSTLGGLLSGATLSPFILPWLGHVLPLDSNTTDGFRVGQTLKFQRNCCTGCPSADHSWGWVPFAVACCCLHLAPLLLPKPATGLPALSGCAGMPGALCSLLMLLLSDWSPPTSISAQKVGHMSSRVCWLWEARYPADASAAWLTVISGSSACSPDHVSCRPPRMCWPWLLWRWISPRLSWATRSLSSGVASLSLSEGAQRPRSPRPTRRP